MKFLAHVKTRLPILCAKYHGSSCKVSHVNLFYIIYVGELGRGQILKQAWYWSTFF